MRTAPCAAPVLCAAALLSCAVSVGVEDRDPPELAVTAPARAAQLETSAVRVGGRAGDSGSGVASVTVNGVAAEVAADGAFTVDLPLEGGVSLIDVVVRDRAGNQTRDVRAVLSGPRSSDGAIASGLMARVTPDGYRLVAEAVLALLAASDLGAAAAAAGTIMSVPGCFEVDLVGLQHSAIGVDLEPLAGGVGVSVEVRDVVVDLAIQVGGVCGVAGSSAPARLRADALWLRGLARVEVSGGRVTPDLSELAADLEGADLDTSLVPAGVVGLLVDGAPAELAGALGGAIGGLAGSLLGDWLGGLDAAEWTTAIQGLDLTVRLAPTAVDAGTGGLAVITSVELRFDQLGPVEYIAGSRAAAPDLDDDSALRVAVADDLANLALAALWTAGRLDRSVELPAEHAARTLLGLDRLELALELPPMVATRAGAARLVIGDARVTAYDLDGAAVMRLAVSAAADLALSAAGGDALVRLVPDAADLWIAPLDQGGESSATLELPGPLELAALDQVNQFLVDALASLPVPDLGEVAAVSGLAAVPGYVVIDADLVGP